MEKRDQPEIVKKEEEVSRRDFLKVAALASALVAVGGCEEPNPVVGRVEGQPEEKLLKVSPQLIESIKPKMAELLYNWYGVRVDPEMLKLTPERVKIVMPSEEALAEIQKARSFSGKLVLEGQVLALVGITPMP